ELTRISCSKLSTPSRASRHAGLPEDSQAATALEAAAFKEAVSKAAAEAFRVEAASKAAAFRAAADSEAAEQGAGPDNASQLQSGEGAIFLSSGSWTTLRRQNSTILA